MSQEDRAWWVEVLGEEEPTRKRMKEIKVREAELREEMDRLGVEWDQCEEQLRECDFARRKLAETAPVDPKEKALEDRIREQYELVQRLKQRNAKPDVIESETKKLHGLMDQRIPFQQAKLTVAGTTHG